MNLCNSNNNNKTSTWLIHKAPMLQNIMHWLQAKTDVSPLSWKIALLINGIYYSYLTLGCEKVPNLWEIESTWNKTPTENILLLNLRLTNSLSIIYGQEYLKRCILSITRNCITFFSLTTCSLSKALKYSGYSKFHNKW